MKRLGSVKTVQRDRLRYFTKAGFGLPGDDPPLAPNGHVNVWRLFPGPIVATAIVGILVILTFKLLSLGHPVPSVEDAVVHVQSGEENNDLVRRIHTDDRVLTPGFETIIDESAKVGGLDRTAGIRDSEFGGSYFKAKEGSESQSIVVHVTGEVNESRVVEIPPGSRVLHAVQAAGGVKETADLSSINLARMVNDGEHIHVDAVGEKPVITSENSETGKTPRTGTQCVDLGSATEIQLQDLPGIGPAMAKRIVEFRSEGGLRTLQDLDAVKGIGPALIEKIQSQICQR